MSNAKGKILESAKSEFIEKGYEGTNMREICSKAGVTTGAFYFHFKDKLAIFDQLVSPVLKDLDQWYEKSIKEFYYLLESGKLNRTWDVSVEQLEDFINYMYEHYDVFKLLLGCSYGTPFYDFKNRIVKLETDITLKFFEEIRGQGGHVNHIGEDEMHLLLHAYYSAMFEIVLHDFDKQRAKKSIHTLYKFFSTGWSVILDIR